MSNTELAGRKQILWLPIGDARVMDRRDRMLRSALTFALHNSTDARAMGALFGALASLVESDEDAAALKLAQAGIIALVGRIAPPETAPAEPPPETAPAPAGAHP